jgi:MazG family protein
VSSSLDQLRDLVARLRRDCPWDREQTPETIKTYLLEETYETLDAIERGDPEALRAELGDLLFQIFFLARLAEERSWFDTDSLARGIHEKMVSRHPHVFGDVEARTASEVKANWEKRKSRDPDRTRDPLAGIPRALPALSAAYRMSSRAADLGFDWEHEADILEKAEEEIREIREALEGHGPEQVAAEIGDLLFTVVNLARREKSDPEFALRRANEKFRKRFAAVANAAAARGRRLEDMTLAEMDALWEKAKAEEPGSDK